MLTPPRQMSPQSVEGYWYGAPKTKNFTNISAYKRSTGAYSMGEFNQIFIICRQLHVRLGVEMWADSVKFWGFKFRGACITPNFRHPIAAKLCVGSEHVFGCASKVRTSSIIMPSLVGLGCRAPPGGEKVQWLFVLFCLFVFVCPSRIQITKFVNATLS